MLLAGCSSFKKNKNPEEAFKALCFTSFGKGRLEHSKGRHLFNYEALFSKEDTSWALALELPLIGQELIRFKPSDGGTQVEGTFANRLKIEVKSPKQKKLLNIFYKKTGELLQLIHGKASAKIKEEWDVAIDGENLLATSSIGKKTSFVLKGFDLDKYYRRLTLSYRLKMNGRDKDLFNLQLFVDECHL